jgi:hypothetical protein
MSRIEERHHTAGELDHMAELERAWVAEEAEREAVVVACLDAYFECETNEIPLCKLETHSIMLEFVRINYSTLYILILNFKFEIDPICIMHGSLLIYPPCIQTG